MEKNNSIYFKGKIGFFLLGVLMTAAVILLTGAVDTSNVNLSQRRYQLSSWGTEIGEKSGVFGAFVMDSVTGETKIVYARLYGNPGTGKVVRDELGTNFVSIQP